MAASARSRYIREPGAGELVDLGGVGVHFKLSGDDTGGAFSIVEHPVAPRALIPSHVHHLEDEYSCVIEGRIGARIGDDIVDAPAGSYLIKPRNIPHTFWNPTDQPARLIEIICPPGFEGQFAEMGQQLATGQMTSEFAEYVGRKYQISNAPTAWDDWLDQLIREHRLQVRRRRPA
jgi:mannose-6-phosphate isomerase-like protein (cupin superfamily)